MRGVLARLSRQVGYFEGLVAHGDALAGVVDEGVIAAMGMIEQNPGNWRCWAVTHPVLTPKYLVVVCKAMRRFMGGHRARRIETVVMRDNSCAERWVKLLGFRNPHLMTAFNENGDAWLYELVR